ncbi:MAG: LLM class F420-dependent oxidoreductase [Dehalococcoidia bacterium]
MKIGLHLPQVGPFSRADVLIPFAQLAERLSFSSLWVSDHVVMAREQRSRYPYSPDGKLHFPIDSDFLEPLTALTFLAGATARIQLGTTVLVLPMRQPVLHAKIIATLDHLAGARFIFGVGAGWWKEEFEVLGASFERRGKRFDEQLELMIRLWSGEVVDFKGAFYSVDGWISRPVPGQRPHPPIWVGGENERSLRRAGRYGDAWHATAQPAQQLHDRMEIVRQAARDAGRDPKVVELTMRTAVTFTEDNLEQSAQRLQEIAALGVTHAIVQVHPRAIAGAHDILSSFAEKYLPVFRTLSAGMPS